MNENPEGTPNPLNPATPEPAPAQPEPMISQPVAQPKGPASAPAQPFAMSNEPAEVPEPMAQSVEVQPEAPKKKSKKPIIIVAILLLLVAIGSAVAAVLILNPFKTQDAVPAALSKLFSTGVPQNIKLTGSITTYDTHGEANFPSISADFSSSINSKTTENSLTATIKATLPSNENFEFGVDELHTADGDLYLKLRGVTDALEALQEQSEEHEYVDCDSEDEDDCVEGDVVVDSSILDVLGMFDVIDDEWILIRGSEFSSIGSIVPSDPMTTCVMNAADKIKSYDNDFVKLYNANPFVEYSTDNIKINKKRNALYRLTFNAEKLAAFVNSFSNSGFANELMACAGDLAVNEDVKAEDLAEVVSALPTIYVEIDDDNNFTRLYIAIASENGLTGVNIDIAFDYPSSAVVVDEPESYITLNELLKELLSDFYETDITE